MGINFTEIDKQFQATEQPKNKTNTIDFSNIDKQFKITPLPEPSGTPSTPPAGRPSPPVLLGAAPETLPQPPGSPRPEGPRPGVLQQVLGGVLSAGSGVLSGLTGLPKLSEIPKLEKKQLAEMSPEERRIYEQVIQDPNFGGGQKTPITKEQFDKYSPRQKQLYLKYFTEPGKELSVPEFKTIEQIGQWGGFALGASNIAKLTTQGAIKVATKAPALGKLMTSAVEHLPIKNAIKLLTPAAVGVGTQAGMTNAVKNIYENGYVDPKIVGEDIALNAGLTFILPELAVATGGLSGKASTLLPQLLRFVPQQLGGYLGVPGAKEAVRLGVQDIKPVQLITGVTLWKSAAEQLQNLYKGAPKELQEHLSGINKLGRFMDSFLSATASRFRTPSFTFKIGGRFPQLSPLRPQQIMQALNRAPNYVRNPAGAITNLGREQSNMGGGTRGAIYHNVLATQLEKLSVEMKADGIYGNKSKSWMAANVAKALRKYAGNLSLGMMRGIDDRLTSLINAPRFNNLVPATVGKRSTPNLEGQYLIFVRDLFRLQVNRGDPYSIASRAVRSLSNHVLLGMGNFFSGITVLNRLSFPLATEGAENVFAALKDSVDNTALYQRISKLLGMEIPSRALGAELKEQAPTELSKLSFGFYNWSERHTLPVAAIAKYRSLTAKGVPYSQAISQAVDYATRLRTSMDWDIPTVFRSAGTWSNVSRIAFQYFPFAIKSIQAAGEMGLEEFARYAGYMSAIAGVKGVPFLSVYDRLLAGFTGHSILNSLLANPTVNDLLRGIPNLAFGVDIGARHNWSQALADRVISMGPGPFGNWQTNIDKAYGDLTLEPSGTTAIKAIKAVAQPISYGITALDDEKHGAILDSHGFPLVKDPTTQELGIIGLGGVPSSVSERRALGSAEFTETERHRRLTTLAEERLRRAYQDQSDKQELGAAIQNAIRLGIKPSQIKDLEKKVNMSYPTRMLRKMPKSIRGGFRSLTELLNQEGR